MKNREKYIYYVHIITDLTQWIDENIERDLTLKKISKKSGYTLWHLQRIFFSVQKIPLGCYIRERRLHFAAEDLHKTTQSILNICLKYGFSSQQAFCRSFKKKYGMPPNLYRSWISKNG